MGLRVNFLKKERSCDVTALKIGLFSLRGSHSDIGALPDKHVEKRCDFCHILFLECGVTYAVS